MAVKNSISSVKHPLKKGLEKILGKRGIALQGCGNELYQGAVTYERHADVDNGLAIFYYHVYSLDNSDKDEDYKSNEESVCLRFLQPQGKKPKKLEIDFELTKGAGGFDSTSLTLCNIPLRDVLPGYKGFFDSLGKFVPDCSFNMRGAKYYNYKNIISKSKFLDEADNLLKFYSKNLKSKH
jgi:hypothetical protein